MKITTKELKDVTISILDRITQEYTDTITIKADYYWNINSEEKYNPYLSPSPPDLGQLTEDLELLISAQNESSSLYALACLGEVFSYVGSRMILDKLSENGTESST